MYLVGEDFGGNFYFYFILICARSEGCKQIWRGLEEMKKIPIHMDMVFCDPQVLTENTFRAQA